MEPIQRMCPLCSVALEREDYESSWSLRCPACRGALISTSRLERIQRDARQSPDLLKKEARAEHWNDTQQRIACPRCHANMEKKPLTHGAASLFMDHCRACDLLWLDGGELALAQLVYEASARGREARMLQQKALQANLSPERQARFERALAQLPDDLPSETPMDDLPWLDILKSLLRL